MHSQFNCNLFSALFLLFSFTFVTQLRTWDRETHGFHLVTRQLFLVKHYLLLIYLFICLLKFRILRKKTDRYFSPHAKPEEKKKKKPTHKHDYFHNVPGLSDFPHLSFSPADGTQNELIFFSCGFLFSYLFFRFPSLPTKILMYDIFFLPFNLMIWWHF